jgi:hypothetical protein
VNAVASIHIVVVVFVLFDLVLDIVGTDFLAIARVVVLLFVDAEFPPLVLVVVVLLVIVAVLLVVVVVLAFVDRAAAAVVVVHVDHDVV